MVNLRYTVTVIGLMICLAFVSGMARADIELADSQMIQSFSQLTERQKIELISRATTMQSNNVSTTHNDSSFQKVDHYSDIAVKLMKGLASGAKEVGITANEFLLTPAGKWTLAVVVYKTMGSDIILFGSALLIFITGFSFTIYMSRRIGETTIKYNTEVKNIFGNHPKMYIHRTPLQPDYICYITICSVVTLFCTCIVLFNVG